MKNESLHLFFYRYILQKNTRGKDEEKRIVDLTFYKSHCFLIKKSHIFGGRP